MRTLSGQGGRGFRLRAGAVTAALLALAGPVPAGELRVILDGQAAVTSDGNYGQSSTSPAATDEDQETVGRAGFDLRLSYDWQRAGLAFVYSPSYEQILEGREEDEERRERDAIAHRLLLGFQGELTRRLSLSVQERLFQTPNLDLYLPPTNPDTLAVTRRGDQLAHNLDLGFRYAATRRFFLTLGANHGLRTFDETDLFDTETRGVSVGGSYQLSEFQSVGASAGLGRFEYEDGREDDVRLLGVSYTFGFGRDTQVSLDAGTFAVDSTFLEPLVPEVPEVPGEEPPTEATPPAPPAPPLVARETEETGWRGGIGISQRRELFNWSLGYRHDLSAGYGLGRAAEADNAYAGISTSLGRRVTVGLDGNISRQRELGDRDEFLTATGDRPLSELAAGTLRLGWEVLPSLRLNAGYSRIWQEARVEPFEDLSYSRYFLGLAFRIFSRGETPKDPLRPEAPEEVEAGDDENEEPDAR